MSQFHRQCVIHLISPLESTKHLEQQLAVMLQANFHAGWFHCAWSSIELNVKESWDRDHGPRPGETHHLEIVAEDSIGTEAFKVALRGFLKELDRAGLRPAAACDFEDELEVR